MKTEGGNFEYNGFVEFNSPGDFDLGLGLAERGSCTRRMRE